MTPNFTKALTLQPAATKLKPVYHEAVLEDRPLPPLKKGEVLVRIGAAAFNHRDVLPMPHPGSSPGLIHVWVSRFG
jgi:NADPH:quinone reductase-like Zn-dependent oxidoreductase